MWAYSYSDASADAAALPQLPPWATGRGVSLIYYLFVYLFIYIHTIYRESYLFIHSDASGHVFPVSERAYEDIDEATGYPRTSPLCPVPQQKACFVADLMPQTVSIPADTCAVQCCDCSLVDMEPRNTACTWGQVLLCASPCCVLISPQTPPQTPCAKQCSPDSRNPTCLPLLERAHFCGRQLFRCPTAGTKEGM